MVRVAVYPTDILDPMFREKPTMTSQFLPKDPEKALLAVKEALYDRLNNLRICLGTDPYTVGWEPDDVERQMMNEVAFLEDLLDIIERSV